MQIIVDKLLVNYRRQGKGPTLLLLHGWADSLQGVAQLAGLLAKAGYDVISIDLPGFGGSQQPEKAWGLADYAVFLNHFLKKARVEELTAVIGHSNGGAIAITAAASGQLKPAKLVLLASAGIRGEQKGRLIVIKLVTKTAKYLTLPLPSSTRQKLRAKLYKTIGSDILAAGNMAASFKRIVSEDVQADAQKISIPTLIIYGEADDITPAAYGRLFHELISGSMLAIISGGHFITKEHPKELAVQIMDFL